MAVILSVWPLLRRTGIFWKLEKEELLILPWQSFKRPNNKSVSVNSPFSDHRFEKVEIATDWDIYSAPPLLTTEHCSSSFLGVTSLLYWALRSLYKENNDKIGALLLCRPFCLVILSDGFGRQQEIRSPHTYKSRLIEFLSNLCVDPHRLQGR